MDVHQTVSARKSAERIAETVYPAMNWDTPSEFKGPADPLQGPATPFNLPPMGPTISGINMYPSLNNHIAYKLSGPNELRDLQVSHGREKDWCDNQAAGLL